MQRVKPLSSPKDSGHLLNWVVGSLVLLVSFCAAYYFVFGADEDLIAKLLTTGLLATAYLVCRPEFLRLAKPRHKDELNLSAIWVICVGIILLLATPRFLDALNTPHPLILNLTPLAGLGTVLVGVAKLVFRVHFINIFLSRYGAEFLTVFVIGYFGFDIIQLIQPIGKTEGIANALQVFFDFTFLAVKQLLLLLGSDVYTNSATREITVENFTVFVWGQCSGIEGFVLISTFISLYMWMFRERLSFPKAFLLFPIGILLSWMLNVVRITILLLLGAHVSESLAVDTFHSQAGWVMFTILSVGLAAGDFAFGWFAKPAWKPSARRSIALSQPELSAANSGSSIAEDGGNSAFNPDQAAPDDPVAQIVPFLIFAATGLFASAFMETPALVYPLRCLAMLCVLYAFRRCILSINWRIDLVAVFLGFVIGCAWCVTSVAESETSNALSAALAEFGALASTVWIVTRMLGTIALVPIIEELFFRGYILSQLDRDTFIWKCVAVCVSAIFFAVLHDRWLAALIAGLIFGYLCIRKNGRLADALVSHATANGVIALWALATNNWTII